jgi:uncharacterized FlaG/YvyC family protein
MAPFPVIKTIASIAVTRVDGEYHIRIEDQSGDIAVYRIVSDQMMDLADMLGDLLSHEEQTAR